MGIKSDQKCMSNWKPCNKFMCDLDITPLLGREQTEKRKTQEWSMKVLFAWILYGLITHITSPFPSWMRGFFPVITRMGKKAGKEKGSKVDSACGSLLSLRRFREGHPSRKARCPRAVLQSTGTEREAWAVAVPQQLKKYPFHSWNVSHCDIIFEWKLTRALLG